MTELCIYHGGCDDGFAALWVVNQAIPGIESFYGVYQEDPPDCTGRDVIMVDFSYKRPVMEKIIEQCSGLVILDHHKSAQLDLVEEGLIFDDPKVGGRFDINHCGAMLAWQWFFDDKKPPPLIPYIEDRDLWRFNLKGTREISQALRSYEQTLENWDDFMRDPNSLIFEGKHISRYHWRKVQEAIPHASLAMIGGHEVPCINAPYFMASDLAGELAKDAIFAAVYWINKNGGITYSLRSRGDFDVSDIAITYGGGGHKNAAGFKTNRIL